MKYIKDTINMIFNKPKSMEKVGLGLTKEQKKKYRKQYFKAYYTLFILSILYIIAIIELMTMLFQDKIWALAIVVLLLRDYGKLIEESKKEFELIEERIHKRRIKNKKQRVIVNEEM